MEDILPNSSIAITVEPETFLNRVSELLATLGGYGTNRSKLLGQIDVLNITSPHKTPHEGLVGQLIADTDKNKLVKVEVRATHWDIEGSLTYEEYVKEVANIFKPILKAYNELYNTRYRLVIQRKANTEPVLPTEANKRFVAFIEAANKQGLHPLDWNRFYRFAKYCHSRRVLANTEDIFRLLVTNGFDEEYAREIATAFGHLKRFQELLSH